MKIVLAALLFIGMAVAAPQFKPQNRPQNFAKAVDLMAKIQAENEAIFKVIEAVQELSDPEFVAKIQSGKEAFQTLDITQSERDFICDFPILGYFNIFC